jgi:hypothetical protein
MVSIVEAPKKQFQRFSAACLTIPICYSPVSTLGTLFGHSFTSFVYPNQPIGIIATYLLKGKDLAHGVNVVKFHKLL